MFSIDNISILACPLCKGKLDPADDQQLLSCQACALDFPVRDGIPVLLVDQAVVNGDAKPDATARDRQHE